MKPPFAARFPLEVFYRVGDVDGRSVDARFFRGAAIEQLPRGADKRLALQIFLIAGLFADKHDLRIPRALSEDGLRCVAIERAGGAAPRRFARFSQIARSGNGRRVQSRAGASRARRFAIIVSTREAAPFSKAGSPRFRQDSSSNCSTYRPPLRGFFTRAGLRMFDENRHRRDSANCYWRAAKLPAEIGGTS